MKVWEHRNAFDCSRSLLLSFGHVIVFRFCLMTDLLDVKVEFGDHEKTDLDQHLAEGNHVTWIVSSSSIRLQ